LGFNRFLEIHSIGGGGVIGEGNKPIKRHLRTIRPQSRIKKLINRMSERETVVEIPFAAD
jgi:hypothetical protein